MSITEKERTYLETGVEKLDDQLEGGGLVPQSVVSVVADPQGHGQRFLWNICGGRPVVYLSIGHGGDEYIDRIATVSQTDKEDIEIIRVPVSDVSAIPDRMRELDTETYPRATLVIDSINLVEMWGEVQIEEVVGSVREFLEDTEGLGVLLGYTHSEDPSARWFTLSSSDSILRIERNQSGNQLLCEVTIERLPFGQELVGSEGARTYSFPVSDEIELSTRRSFST